MNLTDDSVPLVYRAIAELLVSYASDELVGISCIAKGADSIFAEAVLDAGGQLEVVVPSKNYRQTKVKPEHVAQFDSLIGRASKVHVLEHDEANREAYEAANTFLLDTCDELFAVWDGQSGVDKGSTGAVVEMARSRSVRTTVIWP